jgi:hypothetical protein
MQYRSAWHGTQIQTDPLLTRWKPRSHLHTPETTNEALEGHRHWSAELAPTASE